MRDEDKELVKNVTTGAMISVMAGLVRVSKKTLLK